MPTKGDVVVNPKTQRPIKVGSRTWIRLVKEGIIDGHMDDPNELCDVEDDEQVDELKKQYDEQLPEGTHAVKGRGKHKNKLVVRRKKIKSSTRALNPRGSLNCSSKVAVRALVHNIDKLAQMNDGEDIEAQLERLIMDEMNSGIEPQPPSAPSSKRGRPPRAPKKRTTRGSRRKPPQPKYEEVSSSESYSDSDSDSESDDGWEYTRF